MKINFLTTKLSGLTGGVIYDEEFYKKLIANFPNQVNLIEDQNFGAEEQNIKPNFWRYRKIYNKYAPKILDCDYLIINSRLYTRFIDFPWYIKPNCKILLIHHHFNFMTHSGIMKEIHKYLEMKFLKRATSIITPNPYTKATILNLGLHNKIALLEAFIDKQIHTSIPHKQNLIFFMGTVEPRKGLHYGIPAFAQFVRQHSSYKFLIAGSLNHKKYVAHLKSMIQKLNLEDKVEFLGRIDENRKARLYQESKCFLFPSQNEGYGWVIIEAMSYGLPVIAFNNTAMPYTVNQKNGRLVKNQSIDEMAIALSEVIDNSELYLKLQQGAYKTVQALPDKTDIEDEYKIFFDSLR